MRVTFDTTPPIDRQIERLMKSTGKTSKQEVLRAALDVYEAVQRKWLPHISRLAGHAEAKPDEWTKSDDLSTLRQSTAGLRSFSGHHGGSTMADCAERLSAFSDRFAARGKVGP